MFFVNRDGIVYLLFSVLIIGMWDMDGKNVINEE